MLEGEDKEGFRWEELTKPFDNILFTTCNSNEFSHLEIGKLSVDGYNQKFIEYFKYCPNDIPIESKKIQRYKLGLSFDIYKQIKSDNDKYATLDQLYKRVARIENVIRK